MCSSDLNLFAEARSLMEKGDDSSSEALSLGRRWNALVAQFTNGRPDLNESARKVWMDALSDPANEPKLPVGRELYAFVGRIMTNLKNAEQP